MTDFISKSGARIVINLAPWKDAKELKKAIERAAQGERIDFDGGDIVSLTSLVLKLDSSHEVDSCLWPCLIRCTRNDEKITEATFNTADARKDYYEIVIACIKENLGPLADSLFSLYAATAAKKKPVDSQK